MAGWLVVWTVDGSPPDTGRWGRSVRAALRYGGTMTENRHTRALLGAWRRDSGEFPRSGTISPVAGSNVAWVGQCVEDSGDATDQALAVVGAERFDGACVGGLNGPFGAAVFREDPFEVRLITDRHRNYPVYVHSGAGVVVASTEIRCIVPWLEAARLDGDSVDMLLRCGELIDRMTMLEGVELLPPGTVMVDQGQGGGDRRYWSMRHDGAGSLEKTADLLADRITTGVRRIEAATVRPGITLSGGLDSRMILDLCEHPDRVPSFTWGLEGCRDIACASEFATLVNSPHTIRHWDPGAFPALWSRGVDVTAGSYGVEGMHMLPFVPLLASACDVVLNGLAGDVLLGGNFLKRAWLREPDIGRLGEASWRWRVKAEEDRLVDRLTGRRSAVSTAQERWKASIAAREGARPVERLHDWLFENRIFRYTNSGTMLLRAGVESHAPFFDRDFVDAIVTARPEDKYKHRLYLEVMKRASPRGASVPWQRTNLAPARGYRATLASMAFHRGITALGRRVGIKPFRSLAVADPPGWFRGPWRKPAEEIILSDRALQRGLFNADAVGETWKAHLGGDERTRQVGMLIAIELFARQVLDGLAPLPAPVPEGAGAAR